MGDSLIQEIESHGIEVYEVKFSSKNIKGLYIDNIIAINKSVKTIAEKNCILAEELGHYHTTVGDILDQSKIENRKQEYKARRWAIKRLIRVEQFIDAFNAGVRNRVELADFLDVTEEFVDMALEHFKAIYGTTYTINEYTICFSPLMVYKSFE